MTPSGCSVPSDVSGQPKTALPVAFESQTTMRGRNGWIRGAVMLATICVAGCTTTGQRGGGGALQTVARVGAWEIQSSRYAGAFVGCAAIRNYPGRGKIAVLRSIEGANLSQAYERGTVFGFSVSGRTVVSTGFSGNVLLAVDSQRLTVRAQGRDTPNGAYFAFPQASQSFLDAVGNGRRLTAFAPNGDTLAVFDLDDSERALSMMTQCLSSAGQSVSLPSARSTVKAATTTRPDAPTVVARSKPVKAQPTASTEDTTSPVWAEPPKGEAEIPLEAGDAWVEPPSPATAPPGDPAPAATGVPRL